MLGMKNHFDISDSIEIPEVDIAGVACILYIYRPFMFLLLVGLWCNIELLSVAVV